MTTQKIIELQKRIGTIPDGIWGAKSAAACMEHLSRLMPTPNPWPTSDDASVKKYFGEAGDESYLVTLGVAGLGIKYDEQNVTKIRCHRLIADALLEAIVGISNSPAAWILEKYAGCYNYRPMRGGKRLSKHAWGIAIDFAPETNGLRAKWPQQADMPIEAMEAFARQGFLSAGAFWGFDAMHFEATRNRV